MAINVLIDGKPLLGMVDIEDGRQIKEASESFYLFSEAIKAMVEEAAREGYIDPGYGCEPWEAEPLSLGEPENDSMLSEFGYGPSEPVKKETTQASDFGLTSKKRTV